MLISKPYTFSVGATVIASEHNANFDIIYADYNGNITNTNLSGSAGITDDKLNQVSTYGKVNGSALSSLGSISASGGIIPILNLPSGTSANQLITASSDGVLPVASGANLTNLPVKWDTRVTVTTSGVTYQATKDGLITAFEQGNQFAQLVGYADTTTAPSIIRHRNYTIGSGALVYACLSFPVFKNEYWKVVSLSTAATDTNVTYTPLSVG